MFSISFYSAPRVYRDCDGGVDVVVPGEWRMLGASSGSVKRYDCEGEATRVVIALAELGVPARVVKAD